MTVSVCLCACVRVCFECVVSVGVLGGGDLWVLREYACWGVFALCVCVCARARARVRACVRVCVRVCVRACVPTRCIDTYKEKSKRGG